ncbi:hypothetical protein J421_4627 (plasmid) [Gemmatirosa kalamazoonensis]|uniref:Uncharacterized protein n=1 Tax=Gemmatirosa kalamazoonensis TaxID=861299 RepID=W0RNU4_9BACT|nr:hypothetical protein [Gemmatirosa kalamazoonensis]AHG92094.1 hypothetical protein J421_4559 [Gemmatirosa kalamazoonensis]AHG92162.1 hypothetical protein J421_4627 [Gemmatirosa kalamazoonensis]
MATAFAATASGSSVILRTPHDHTIVVQALEQRAEALAKRAKQLKDDGYRNAARTIDDDAAAIRTFILPQFAQQQELELATTETVEDAIAAALAGTVRGMLIVRAPQDRQEDALQSREENLSKALAKRVAAYATRVAEHAYAAGFHARGTDPETIALSAAQSLYA